MLAIFHHSVAKIPEVLKNPDTDFGQSSTFQDLVQYFVSLNQNPVTVNPVPINSIPFFLMMPSALMAYSSREQNTVLPSLFSVVDGIFCIFQGHLENIDYLKHQYGLTNSATEVTIIIEAYRLLRERGSYPLGHVVKDFVGKFALILYDVSMRFIFTAGDVEGSVPFFWGSDSDNDFVLSTDETFIKKACLKSYAPFPKGCFFTSGIGLSSYAFFDKKLKPTPWVNSLGEVCGAAFEVDMGSIY